jgi:lipoprotein-releasing system ATP-binding protein
VILEAQNIHKAYANAFGPVEVLKGVGLRIEEGSFTAIVGPSGAGKSTLLHILGGLDSPTKGSVRFNGEELYRLSDAALCRLRNQRIGFVFQFYHLLSEFNVLENVLMPAFIQQGSSAQSASSVREYAFSLLSRVGLAKRVSHFPNQLSGGEQQRTAMVRALINKPALLLCDEPTGNLDSKTGEETIALMQQFIEEEKMTAVLVTHNPDLAGRADKKYHLKDGVLF